MLREKIISLEIIEPNAPDGGYGWLVVFAAFISHVITHGILYSFGVLFITIQDKYGGSKVEVSWILSIATGMLYLVGPIAGYLSNRFGIKMVTIIGTVLGSLGYVISMFVLNLRLLYVTIGLITGCGFGMVFLGSIVIVTMYFEKRRSLASGIALSGAGSGAFIFSPLIKMLTSTFSWNGTMLILSGIILNCLCCALIFKPVTSYKVKKKSSSGKINTGRATKDKLSLEEGHIEQYDRAFYHSQEPKSFGETYQSNIDNSHAPKTSSKNRSEGFAKHDGMEARNLQCMGNQLENTGHLEGEESTPCLQTVHETSYSNKNVLPCDEQYKENCGSVEQTEQFLVDNTQTKTISNDDSVLCNCKMLPPISSQFDLFRSKVFVIFAISQFLFFTGFYQPFFYIPDRAKQRGITQELSVWVVSSIGISSIIGRIIFGYIADKPSVNRMHIFQAALLIAGVSTSLGPTLDGVWSLFVYAIVYGISTGIVLSLTPVILSDLLGIGRLADAFGINNFFCGTASLIGPPLAGFLYDISGSYTLSFIVAGLFITTSGLLICLVNCF